MKSNLLLILSPIALSSTCVIFMLSKYLEDSIFPLNFSINSYDGDVPFNAKYSMPFSRLGLALCRSSIVGKQKKTERFRANSSRIRLLYVA